MARKKKSSLGCLFWIALILLVLVVFLFSRDRISSVLTNTGFDPVLKIFQPKEKDPEVKRIDPEGKVIEEVDSGPAAESQEPEQLVDSDPSPQTEEPAETEQEIELPDLTSAEEEESGEEEPPLVDKKLRTSVLYFVTVGEDGSISLQHVSRPVYYEASPLTRTMEALLEGLSPQELNKGLLSLIPAQSRIRSIAVKGGTAHIDFTEAFAFNEFGAEGADASLKQVVYTATEFTTVTSVQITIEGRKRSFLVSEGIPISGPLNRDSFQTAR